MYSIRGVKIRSTYNSKPICSVKCIMDLFKETLLEDRKSILEKSMSKEKKIFFLGIESIEREGWLINK